MSEICPMPNSDLDRARDVAKQCAALSRAISLIFRIAKGLLAKGEGEEIMQACGKAVTKLQQAMEESGSISQKVKQELAVVAGGPVTLAKCAIDGTSAHDVAIELAKRILKEADDGVPEKRLRNISALESWGAEEKRALGAFYAGRSLSHVELRQLEKRIESEYLIACRGRSIGRESAPSEQSKDTRRKGRKSGGGKQTEKRSWTQPDLDRAIDTYKARRASNYHELVSRVEQGCPGAEKAAREMFGRNAIVRALGVKSSAMVSKSGVWQGMADALGLRDKTKKNPRPGRAGRVGYDIAIEEGALLRGDPVEEEMIRRETISLIQAKMPPKIAESAVHMLTSGDIDDDQARELVDAFADQQKDSRARKIYQVP